MGRTVISEDGCFEWNDEKAEVNRNKHGITFEEAALVFFDPLRVEMRDILHSVDEERYITIGSASRRKVMLVIVFSTEKNGRTRLISARLASRIEEGLYYGE